MGFYDIQGCKGEIPKNGLNFQISLPIVQAIVQKVTLWQITRKNQKEKKIIYIHKYICI